MSISTQRLHRAGRVGLDLPWGCFSPAELLAMHSPGCSHLWAPQRHCNIPTPGRNPTAFQQGVRGPCPAFVAEGAAGTGAAANPLIVPQHISATFSSTTTTQQGLNHIIYPLSEPEKGIKPQQCRLPLAAHPKPLSPSPIPVLEAGCSLRPHLVPAPGMAQQRRGAPWVGISRVHRHTHTRMASSLIPRAINRYFRRLRAPEEIG